MAVVRKVVPGIERYSPSSDAHRIPPAIAPGLCDQSILVLLTSSRDNIHLKDIFLYRTTLLRPFHVEYEQAGGGYPYTYHLDLTGLQTGRLYLRHPSLSLSYSSKIFHARTHSCTIQRMKRPVRFANVYPSNVSRVVVWDPNVVMAPYSRRTVYFFHAGDLF